MSRRITFVNSKPLHPLYREIPVTAIDTRVIADNQEVLVQHFSYVGDFVGEIRRKRDVLVPSLPTRSLGVQEEFLPLRSQVTPRINLFRTRVED